MRRVTPATRQFAVPGPSHTSANDVFSEVLMSHQALASGVTARSIPVPSPTSHARLDETLSRLRAGARRFATISLDERIALAGDMQAGYLAAAADGVRVACEAKGIAPGSPREGEEWGAPWFVVRQ